MAEIPEEVEQLAKWLEVLANGWGAPWWDDEVVLSNLREAAALLRDYVPRAVMDPMAQLLEVAPFATDDLREEWYRRSATALRAAEPWLKKGETDG